MSFKSAIIGFMICWFIFMWVNAVARLSMQTGWVPDVAEKLVNADLRKQAFFFALAATSLNSVCVFLNYAW